ncbi:MAG: chemotaxis protein CheC [Clostridiales bacterium]|jgi:chemotaxis protein CheC|nr:chemotaxis protein CheC [Clostridiales bacterium]
MKNLNDAHFDFLRELSNIGTGNAVSSLAKLLNGKVSVALPNVRVADFAKIADFIGGSENIIAGVLVDISGGLSGMMMFLMERGEAKKLSVSILGENGGEDGDSFNPIELSMLAEIGNILVCSYIDSLSRITGKKILPSTPHVAIDTANAILSAPATEFGKTSDEVFFVESTFCDYLQRISGFFMFIPNLDNVTTIFEALGVV